MTVIGDEVVVRGERYKVFLAELSERTRLMSFYLRRLSDESDWLMVGRRVQHNSHPVPAPRHLVEIVAYGNAVHIYNVGDDSASVVYTTAIGANVDAVRAKLSPWHWRALREAIDADEDDRLEVHDHR